MKSRDIILEKEAEVAYFQAADSRDITKLKEAAGIANATANEFMREGRFRDALKWAERDLTVALQLPPSELFSTWHTYGELYFRWGKFKKAGTYMKKHLDLAEGQCSEEEKEKAHTQLGRLYSDLFQKTSDISHLELAEEHINKAYELAGDAVKRGCKDSQRILAGASCNKGVLCKDLDDHEGAKEYLQQSLELCEMEEIPEVSTDVHFNLAQLYFDMKNLERAMKHIDTDITICLANNMRTELTKAYLQKASMLMSSASDGNREEEDFEDAGKFFNKAEKELSGREDEDDLRSILKTNRKALQNLKAVHEEFSHLQFKQKSYARRALPAYGRVKGQKMMMKERASILLELIEKGGELKAWNKVLEAAKELEMVAAPEEDETLAFAYLWQTQACLSLGMLLAAETAAKKSYHHCLKPNDIEGICEAKIQLGNVSDSLGDYEWALEAYQTAYKYAREQGVDKFVKQQLAAAENMHYIHLKRIRNADKAREMQLTVRMLEQKQAAAAAAENAAAGRDSPSRDADGDSPQAAMAEKEGKPRDRRQHRQIRRPLPEFIAIESSEEEKDSENEEEDVQGHPKDSKQSFRVDVEGVAAKIDEELASAARSNKVGVSSVKMKQLVLGESGKVKRDRASCGAVADSPDRPCKMRKASRVVDDGDDSQHSYENREEKGTIVVAPDSDIDSQSGGDVPSSEKGPEDGQRKEILTRKAGQSPVLGSLSAERDGAVVECERHTFVVESAGQGSGEQKVQSPCPVVPPTPPVAASWKLPATGQTSRYETGGEAAQDVTHLSSSPKQQLPITRVSTPAPAPGVGGEGLVAREAAEPESHRDGGKKTESLHLSVNTAIRDTEAHVKVGGNHGGTCCHDVLVAIGQQLLRVSLEEVPGGSKTVAWLCRRVAEQFFAINPSEQGQRILRLKHRGVTLAPHHHLTPLLDEMRGDEILEAESTPEECLPVTLLCRYMAVCNKIDQPPNPAVLQHLQVEDVVAAKREALQNSVVCEEVRLAACRLRNEDVHPLLQALTHASAVPTAIILSHNNLKSPVMEGVIRCLGRLGHPTLALNLDLHCNHFGPSAVSTLCSCPLVMARLESLDLSANFTLTDRWERSLAHLIQSAPELRHLAMEACGMSSRTVRAIARSLLPASPLSTLRIGRNRPITAEALATLLAKLQSLPSFEALDIRSTGTDTSSCPAISSFLTSSRPLQLLLLSGNNIGEAGVTSIAKGLSSRVSQTLPPLHTLALCGCGIKAPLRGTAMTDLLGGGGVANLQLRGNLMGRELFVRETKEALQMSSSLKSLDMSNCGLRRGGVLALLDALAGNTSLEKLLVAANVPIPPATPSSKLPQPGGNSEKHTAAVGGVAEPEIAPESEEDDDEEAADMTDKWRSRAKHAGPTLIVPAVKEGGSHGSSRKDGVEKMYTYNDTPSGSAQDLVLYRGVLGDWEANRMCEPVLYGSCSLCIEEGDRWHATGSGSKGRQVVACGVDACEFEGRLEEAIGRIEGVMTLDLSRNGISHGAGKRLQHAFLARESEK